MVLHITTTDIDTAVKSIDVSKAPGIDGFNSFFFRETWDLVKHDVYEAVLHFFDTEVLVNQWNCSSLTLVPKVQNPSYVKDYRPIACCSVLYKIISKIITMRLADVVGDVVNDAQAGFVPGKHIADNILLATELIKKYTNKNISPRCMIKVDLKKAYDSMEWSYLDTVLREL